MLVLLWGFGVLLPDHGARVSAGQLSFGGLENPSHSRFSNWRGQDPEETAIKIKIKA